nr:DUF4411 family protein [Rhizobium leguminosarum]
MRFLLDTNVFIEAKNRYCAFDICPGFWEWMDSVCEGDVASIVSVRDEMTNGTDELADWAKNSKDAAWFLEVDDTETQGNFAEIVQHVASAHYKEPAVASRQRGRPTDR